MSSVCEKTVKSIPASDIGLGVCCRTRSGREYVIVQNAVGTKHTLWAVLDDGYRRLGSSSSPIKLYSLIEWND